MRVAICKGTSERGLRESSFGRAVSRGCLRKGAFERELLKRVLREWTLGIGLREKSLRE